MGRGHMGRGRDICDFQGQRDRGSAAQSCKSSNPSIRPLAYSGPTKFSKSVLHWDETFQIVQTACPEFHRRVQPLRSVQSVESPMGSRFTITSLGILEMSTWPFDTAPRACSEPTEFSNSVPSVE
jgi:hypothetical protein